MALHHSGASFVSELSYNDLLRLRQVVKRVHMKEYPAELCTQAECDRIIESLGPKIREKLVKQAVDSKYLER